MPSFPPIRRGKDIRRSNGDLPPILSAPKHLDERVHSSGVEIIEVWRIAEGGGRGMRRGHHP